MTRTLLLICVILAAAPAMCADATSSGGSPAQAAPQYQLPQGARMLTEINLGQSDVLDMVKKAIPAFAERAKAAGGDVGSFVDSLNFEQLTEAIKGINAIRIVEFGTDQTVKPEDIVANFAAQVPDSAGWTRIYYSAKLCPGGLFVIYTHGGQRFLGVMANPRTNTHYAVSIDGFVNLEKLAAWAGNAVGKIPKKHLPADLQIPPGEGK